MKSLILAAMCALTLGGCYTYVPARPVYYRPYRVYRPVYVAPAPAVRVYRY